ncbi:MAG: hypothetical protein DRI90_05515 [Deltaproteobacteria bacterium]|nr:MAG: hypothetical protein DRI90_05515 [Deltaproteobacteria bacterium]
MDESETKAGALLLWGLMGTADGDLAKFRRQRIGRKSELDLDHLRRVRSVVRALVVAIRNDDEVRWERVREAAVTLADPSCEELQAPAASGDDEEDGSERGGTAAFEPPPIQRPSGPVLPPVIAPITTRDQSSPWASKAPAAPGSEPRSARDDEPTMMLPAEQLVAEQAPLGGEQRSLDATLDPDSADHEALPFEPADPGKKPAGPPLVESPDPRDPDAETVKLRAHVMPFIRRSQHASGRAASHGKALDDEPSSPGAASQEDVDELPVSEGLKRYAEFCAECVAHPDRAAAIRFEYGVIGDDAREILDLEWNERFADDPRLLVRWEHLYEKKLGRLRDRKK